MSGYHHSRSSSPRWPAQQDPACKECTQSHQHHTHAAPMPLQGAGAHLHAHAVQGATSCSGHVNTAGMA